MATVIGTESAKLMLILSLMLRQVGDRVATAEPNSFCSYQNVKATRLYRYVGNGRGNSD
jgi:hypothetical protein